MRNRWKHIPILLFFAGAAITLVLLYRDSLEAQETPTVKEEQARSDSSTSRRTYGEAETDETDVAAVPSRDMRMGTVG